MHAPDKACAGHNKMPQTQHVPDPELILTNYGQGMCWERQDATDKAWLDAKNGTLFFTHAPEKACARNNKMQLTRHVLDPKTVHYISQMFWKRHVPETTKCEIHRMPTIILI